MTDTALRLCAYCSNEYAPSAPNHAGKWCSTKCHNLDYKMRERERKREQRAVERELVGDGTLPALNYAQFDWDGQSRYSAVEPMQLPYVRKCFLCGRHPEIEWLTARRVGLLSLAGLGACDVCGGWRFLDLQEVSGMGSPTRAAPARTVAEPVRAVRHHAA